MEINFICNYLQYERKQVLLTLGFYCLTLLILSLVVLSGIFGLNRTNGCGVKHHDYYEQPCNAAIV